jgi:hypothetical protein
MIQVFFCQEDLELLGRIHAAFEYADCQGRPKHGDLTIINSGKLVAGPATEGNLQIDEFMYVHHSS